jgi:hypothetical protein
VTCPLCRTALSELNAQRLDYHHWQREPDRGVCLCRTCHDAISGQQRDAAVDWEAQELGLRDKHDLQITRLAVREQAVRECASLATLVEHIQTRYNLVQPRTHLFALLSQTLSDGEILTHIHDEYLLAGLPSVTV